MQHMRQVVQREHNFEESHEESHAREVQDIAGGGKPGTSSGAAGAARYQRRR